MALHGISYRRDIDGLRALAVVFVVIFHAYPRALPGGFIGVDVFFVISGFLITSIIYKEIFSGNFNFASFYSRRINRIFPALLLMLLVVLLSGWGVLFSEEFSRLGLHVIGSGFFSANLLQWSEAGYFDSAALKKPLLHLWSLGIEEQFYIFWPLLLLFFRRHYGVMIICVVAFSFALNVMLVEDYPEAAFYMPLSRFWELAAGAVLATRAHVLPVKWQGTEWFSARMANGTSLAGLMLLLGAALLMSESGFPGWWALIPVLGAIMIIGAGDGWVNNRVLSSSVMVWFGLISYPLYLWHWPALSFINIVGLKGDGFLFSAIAFSILMAWITYKYLELPLRKLKKRSALLLALNILIIIFGIFVCTKMLPARLEGSRYESVAASRSDWAFPPSAATAFTIGPYDAYRLAGKTNAEVLFLGDSNMQQFAPRIEFLIKAGSQYSAVFLARGGCRPIPHVASMANNKCLSLADSALSYIGRGSVKRVVIAARWADFFHSDRYGFMAGESKTPLSDAGANRKAVDSMIGFVRSIQRHGVEVFIVQNIPSGPVLVDALDQLNPVSVRLGMGMEKDYQSAAEVTMSVAEVTRSNARGIISAVATETGAQVIDPVASVCREEACGVMYEHDKLIYKDYTHFSASYARRYAGFMDVTLEN